MSCGGCHSNPEIKEVEQKELKLPKTGKIVILTEAAANKVKDFMKAEKKEKQSLRIHVVPGGCAGYMYGMDFENDAKEQDIILEDKGVKMLIDKKSASHLVGTTIDFIENLNENGFKINNPNAQQSCGCGKSFN